MDLKRVVLSGKVLRLADFLSFWTFSLSQKSAFNKKEIWIATKRGNLESGVNSSVVGKFSKFFLFDFWTLIVKSRL